MVKIGLGLIGCGGRLNGVVYGLLEATKQAEVVALTDPSAESISQAQELFGAESTVYADYHDLVQDPRVDWVMIGSWNCFHAEQTIAAFAAGKHVFCEKPLATTLEDCLAMYRAWQRSGRMFNIGFTLRYSPHYMRIKELLSSGAIGQVLSMEFNETLHFAHGGFIHADWRRKTANAGTHLLEKCCHDIDLVNWMLESRTRRVASFGGCNFFTPQNAHHIDRLGTDPSNGRKAYSSLWREHPVDPFNADKDIADTQVAILEYENGVHATFHASCHAGIPERRMYFCGTEGGLRADVITGKIELCRIGFDTQIEDASTDASGGHGGGDSILCESLAAMMVNGDAPKASLEDGLRSAVTCFGIDDAMTSGTVVDMAPYWAQVDEAIREGTAV
ncbi:MAG: Gfo/Idh/MocA family protein [Armatimonadota bacterium]